MSNPNTHIICPKSSCKLVNCPTSCPPHTVNNMCCCATHIGPAGPRHVRRRRYMSDIRCCQYHAR
ncbi:hypothetical protein GQ44DRAFT_699690 [Phaeosphaeriaceae sp. PMI808]|nr:hypothetical protein GQ44DRAFT_699690 [Phaeosphaeriaceae sp. PMI808]